MIHTVEGDLFEREAEVYINPVNCEGVMGKGIAKEFARRYPAMLAFYKDVCAAGNMHGGQILVWPTDGENPRYIYNLATKEKWRNQSKWVWIHQGLYDTILSMKYSGLTTVALPALGCGEGRLDFDMVQKGIYNGFSYYSRLYEIEMYLYRPH